MAKLTALNSPILTKPIAAYDVETYGDRFNTFRMGSIMRDNKIEVYWDKEIMGDILKSKFYSRYMTFATNLQFDWNCLYSLDDNWDLLFNGGRLIRATHTTNHTSQYDTMNLAPDMSVKKMGISLKLPKLKMNNFAQATDEEIKIYNLRDTEITYRWMIWFQNEVNKLGAELKPTIASTALDLWRRKYLYEDIHQPSWLKNKITYESYYGGRTECFKKGFMDKKFYVYDINSMYSYTMKKTEFPDINSMKWNDKNDEDYIMEYEGCAKVDIYIPPSYVPILPFKHMDRLLFPCGFLTGVWTNCELRYAIQHGAMIKKIYWNLYSENTRNYFATFIDDLYALRMEYAENDKPEEKVVKRMMNGGYGKFATQIDKKGSGILRAITDDTTIEDLIGAMIYDNKYYIKQLTRIPTYILPILSSTITSQSRILLHGYLINGTVYYTDTDSLFSPDILPVSKKLGDLKLEYTVGAGWIFGNKMYYLFTDELEYPIIKCKGIPYSQLDIFYSELFDRLDRKLTINFTKFIKTKEALRRKYLPNEIIDYKKTISLYNFDKRMWLKPSYNIFRNNTDTIPYYIKNNKIMESKDKYIRSEINI